eukprot:5527852-Pleurochrysis_carterae.AAC.1
MVVDAMQQAHVNPLRKNTLAIVYAARQTDMCMLEEGDMIRDLLDSIFPAGIRLEDARTHLEDIDRVVSQVEEKDEDHGINFKVFDEDIII